MSIVSARLQIDEAPTYETRLSNMMRSLEHVMPRIANPAAEVASHQLPLPESKTFVIVQDFMVDALLHDLDQFLKIVREGPAPAMRQIHHLRPQVIPVILGLLRVLTNEAAFVAKETSGASDSIRDWLESGDHRRLLVGAGEPQASVVADDRFDVWGEKFAELSQRSDPTKALQHLYSRIDELSDDERFDELDRFVSSFEAESLSTTLLVGLLRITYPFKDRLPSWSGLLRAAHGVIRKRNLDPHVVLAGLSRS